MGDHPSRGEAPAVARPGPSTPPSGAPSGVSSGVSSGAPSGVSSGAPDPYALLRSRSYVGLLVLAAVVGVPVAASPTSSSRS